jgi:hypothetical protein
MLARAEGARRDAAVRVTAARESQEIVDVTRMANLLRSVHGIKLEPGR